jgi:hypothetical protein
MGYELQACRQPALDIPQRRRTKGATQEFPREEDKITHDSLKEEHFVSMVTT